jgi:Na+/glutamate symporter
VAERPTVRQNVNLAALVDPNIAFDFKTAESPEERASRLRREEAEDAHKRRISLIVHVFVMTIVALAFGASVYILVTQDPKTNLPDKAIGIITAIVAALLGYLTGKGSK